MGQEFKIPSRIFKSLCSESGLRIFTFLGRVKEMCVSDIAREVHLSMSAASHQLKRMEAAGLVESVRTGRTICYVFRKSRVNRDLLACLRNLAQPLMRKGRL